jgi:hypothetical protein
MEIVPEPEQLFPYHSERRCLVETTFEISAHVHPRPVMLETDGGFGLLKYLTHTNMTEEGGVTEDVTIGLAAAGWPVAKDEEEIARTTVTAVLLALSAPVHAPCVGVTVYFHDPEGTEVSVHVSALTVPEHPDPMVWSTSVVALYRLTVYPFTFEPLLNVLVVQLTVTAGPLAVAAGVFPAEMDNALLYPDAVAEWDQRASAAWLPPIAIATATTPNVTPRRQFIVVSPGLRTRAGSSCLGTRSERPPPS